MTSVPTPTDVWFLTPPGVTSVPPAPPADTAPATISANSASVDASFDPANVDTAQIFDEILPQTPTTAIYLKSRNSGNLLPTNITRRNIKARLRCVCTIRTSRYDLQPKSYEYTTVTKLVAVLSKVKVALSCDTGNYSLTGNDLVFDSRLPLAAGSGTFILNRSASTLILSHFDTDYSEEVGLIPVLFPGYPTWGFYGQDDTVLPDIVPFSKFGGGALMFRDGFSDHLYAYIPWSVLNNPTGDFTMQAFFYTGLFDLRCTPFALGDQTGTYGYAVRWMNNRLYILKFPAENGDAEIVIFESAKFYTPETWYHVTLEQAYDGLRLYVDGEVVADRATKATVLDAGERLDLRNAILVGGYADTPGNYLDETSSGHVDEFRLVDSALYQGASFDTPTAPYTIDIEAAGEVNLGRVYFFNVAPSSFVLKGENSALGVVTTLLVGVSGSYALSGQDILLGRTSYKMSVEPGAFTLTGVGTFEVSFVAANGYYTNQAVRLPLPSGTAINDLGILVIESSSQLFRYGPVYPPYGWTSLSTVPIRHEVDLVAASYLNVFYRVIDDLDHIVEVSLPSNHNVILLSTFRGVDTDSPFIENPAIEAPAGTSLTFPSLTERVPSTLILDILVGGTDSSILPQMLSRSNSSSRWANVGLLTNMATNFNDGGFAAMYAARTKWEGTGLPGTIGTSNKATHLLMTLALRPTGWGGPVVIALSADPGAVTLGGQAAILKPSRVGTLVGDAGAFSATGIDTQFNKTNRIVPATGSYTLTGQDAYIGRPPIVMAAEAGVFTLTGQVAAFALLLKVLADAVSFTVTGQNAGFALGLGDIDGGDATSILVDAYDGGDATSNYTDVIDGGTA